MIKRHLTGETSLQLPDRRSDLTKVPVVYFIAVTCPGIFDEPRIKIGETGDYNKRFKDHEKAKHGVGYEVAPLCMVRGTRADEQQVLRYFDRYKLDNEAETFRPVDELVDYVRWLRDQHFVWVPDCPQCPRIEDLDCVDSALWTPRPERRKKRPAQQSLFNDFGTLGLPQRDVTPDDFYTNKIVIQAARRTLGHIDLDPASHAYANMVVKADRFCTVNDNGLIQEWGGRVWLNPPFSEWQAWVPKIISEWRSGRIEAMCVLCATRTLTAQYFSAIHEACAAMCVLRGRIRFWGGKAGDSPDDGHAVFYFGDKPGAFAEAFGAIGNVYNNIWE